MGAESFAGFEIRQPDCVFIGGAWRRPQEGGTIDVISPSTEAVAISVAEAREAEMALAVSAARQAFDAGPWPNLTHRERGARLQALAAELRLRKEELAHAWTRQSGALFAIAPGMVASAIGVFDYYARLAGEFAFVEPRKTATGVGAGFLVREPVGVVAAIAPWNAPFSIMAYKIAPALLAGCTVIMKPAPETPIEAYIIAEAAEAAGFPPGVINLVPAHREASDFLVRQPGIDKVSFTGSTAAGKRIASVCGERIARCTLELGGKSAAIVLDDYAVEDAVDRLTGSLCLMSGQVCAALTRVVVARGRHDQFAECFADRLGKIRVGDSYEPTTQMGPLAMRRQLDRVETYVAKGIAEGARLVIGGGRPPAQNRGFFFEPTLFAAVDNRMTIAQEEIFGPVLSLIPSDDVDDAVRIANESNYGLNGAVFTHDADAAYRIARRVRTGNFAQNGFRADFSIAFGGFKQSGIGREGGVEGLLPYLETKTVLLDSQPSAVS